MTGLSERLFALWYPPLIELSERAGQREVRARLLATATGRTLELGAGAGHNLPHYGPAVDELVVSEPSPAMLDQLRERLAADPPHSGAWELIQAGVDDLPFEPGSFDTVVATFVFCSVPDPARGLEAIARVLRPGGRFLFIEHVRAPEGTLLGRAQDLLERPQSAIAAGCHPNRRTEELIAASPLGIEQIEHRPMPWSIPTVRPTIVGSARREP